MIIVLVIAILVNIAAAFGKGGKLLSVYRFLANRIRSIWRRFRIRTLLLRHDGGEIQRTVAASDRRTPLTDRQGMLPMQLAA
jgi:hypothetical protein